MKFIVAFFLAIFHIFAHAQPAAPSSLPVDKTKTTDQCFNGQCYGYGPPSGICNSAANYKYGDFSTAPSTIYTCVNSAWAATGVGPGSGVGAATRIDGLAGDFVFNGSGLTKNGQVYTFTGGGGGGGGGSNPAGPLGAIQYQNNNVFGGLSGDGLLLVHAGGVPTIAVPGTDYPTVASVTAAASAASAASTAAATANTNASTALSTANTANATATAAAAQVPMGTQNQIAAWCANGSNLCGLYLGTGLTISGGYLNGSSSSGTVSSGTTNQLGYYSAAGTTLSGLTLGTNLSVTAGVLNATGGSSSGTVSTGTTGKLAGYTANGTTVGPITLGTNLSMTGSTLNATGGSGTTLPANLTGTQTDSSGNAVQQTPDNAYAILGQSPDPTQFDFTLGTSGNPCPVPTTGHNPMCFKDGTIQISYNGGGYAPIPTVSPSGSFVDFYPATSNVTSADGGGTGSFNRFGAMFFSAQDAAVSVARKMPPMTIKSIDYYVQLVDCNAAVATGSGGGNKGLTISLYDVENGATVPGTSVTWIPTNNFGPQPSVTSLAISVTAGHHYAVNLVGVNMMATCNTVFGASANY